MTLKGSDLQYLAAVSELARLDLESASVGLVASEGQLTARYHSPYALGERLANYDGPAFACEVDAERFKTLSSLFPSDRDVDLSVERQSLVIKSKGPSRRALSMQIQRDEVDTPSELDTCKASLTVRVNADQLRNEFDLAKEFVAKNYAQPLLTGVNLEVSGDRVKLTAWDSISALFTSTLQTTELKKNTGILRTTVPTLDFELGLKVMGGGETKLQIVERDQGEGLIPVRVRFETSAARFSCTPLIGSWPDLSPVINKKKWITSLELSGPALRDAVTGVKALSPNYAKSGIEITTDRRKHLVVQTRQAEHGQFLIRAGTKVDEDVSFTYSVASMALASKIGDLLTFDIPQDERAQTRISSRDRRCWVSPTV